MKRRTFLASAAALVATKAKAAFGIFQVNGPGGGGGGSFTPTLQAIDGGATYYATNSFTPAATSRTLKFSNIGFTDVPYTSGWDDPKFIPIGSWLGPMNGQSDANRCLDLYMNTLWACFSNADLPTLLSNGISLVQLTGQLGAGEFGGIAGSGAETVGMMTCDEPQNWTESVGGIGTVASQNMTGSISNSFLTVTAMGAGNTLVRNIGLSGTGIVAGASINGGFGTGNGGIGNYGMSNQLATSANLTMTASGSRGPFTVTPSDTAPFVGQVVRLRSQAAPTNIMTGTISAYTGSNTMTVTVTSSTGGSSSFTGWDVILDTVSGTITVATLPGNVNSFQDHRFWWLNNTNAFIDQTPGTPAQTPAPNTVVSSLTTTVNTPSGVAPWDKRHIDMISIDAYLISAGSNFNVGLTHANIYGIFNLFGSSTTLNIGTSPVVPGGTINFTISGTNVNYVVGGNFEMQGSPGNIIGTITAIAGTAVTAIVSSISGSGSASSWSFLYGLSAQQMNRPAHYGDQVDALRSLQAGNFPAPCMVFLENGDPFTNIPSDSGNRLVTSAELNAMAWSIFIHGGRQIPWFNNDANGSPSGGSGDNFANSFYQSGGGGMASDTISMYDRAKATHACIATVAPIINSPTCITPNPFITGISSNGGAGFVLPLTSGLITAQNGFSKFNGDLSGTPGSNNGKFEAVAKYYQGGTQTINGVVLTQNKPWIFAAYRGPEADTSIGVTFTVASSGATTVTRFYSDGVIGAASNGAGGTRITCGSTAFMSNGDTARIFGTRGTVTVGGGSLNASFVGGVTVVDATHFDIPGAFAGALSSAVSGIPSTGFGVVITEHLITMGGGGTTIADTFPTGNSIGIYRVN